MTSEPETGPGHHEAADHQRSGQGLEDDRKLFGIKMLAGVTTVVALVAMLITSLSREPIPFWMVVLAGLSIALVVLMGVRLVRVRTGRSTRRTGGQ